MIEEPYAPAAETKDSACCTEIEQYCRENPTRSILFAVGLGIAVGLVLRSLRPHSVESRTTRLLADIQDRLHELGAPAFDRATRLAEEGSTAVKEGLGQLHDLHLERGLRNFGRRLRSIFN